MEGGLRTERPLTMIKVIVVTMMVVTLDRGSALPSQPSPLFLHRAAAGDTASAAAALLETKGFIASAAGQAAGASMGGEIASVADRENCVGCKFIWSKVNALLDQSSGYEAVKDAFERTCANMPDVFYDVCDTMFDREDEMIQMYLNNMEFKAMCDKIQVCLN